MSDFFGLDHRIIITNLASCLVQAEMVPQFLLADSAGRVDLVTENEERDS